MRQGHNSIVHDKLSWKPDSFLSSRQTAQMWWGRWVLQTVDGEDGAFFLVVWLVVAVSFVKRRRCKDVGWSRGLATKGGPYRSLVVGGAGE